jgi:hypothetical protein
MSGEKQDFLRRWSRRKLDSAATSAVTKRQEQKPPESPPELPPVDSLTFESDFKSFMHSKVEQGVKRAALKKLFSDPRFNLMDGLDTYIDDYSKEDPIPDEMMARLEHARQTLFGRDKEKQTEQAKPAEPEKPAQTADNDVDPAQDPKAL